jgi:hypothetical protein
VPLNLYRRHRPGCEAGYPEERRSGEFDERKRGWKRCACVIFVSGMLGGKFARKATGTADWDEARRISEGYEKAGSWTGDRQPELATLEPEPTVSKPRITVEDACKVFVINREAAGLAPATLESTARSRSRLARTPTAAAT